MREQSTRKVAPPKRWCFLYNKKNISVAKTKLKLENESIITIKGYDEMADWMIQKIKKEDKVIMQGELDTRMEVVVKWMKGFMY